MQKRRKNPWLRFLPYGVKPWLGERAEASEVVGRLNAEVIGVPSHQYPRHLPATPVVRQETQGSMHGKRNPNQYLYEQMGLIDVRKRTISFRVRKHDSVREPEAGDPHVRFDERDVETESRFSYLGADIYERIGNRHAEPTATAPHLDSTQYLPATRRLRHPRRR